MSFIRLLLFGLLAFVLIRIIRTVVHMMKNRRRQEEEQPSPTTRDTGTARRWTDIRDAEFEDLTPPPPKADDPAGGDRR